MSENYDSEELERALPNGEGSNHVTTVNESNGTDQGQETVDKDEDADVKNDSPMHHVESKEDMFVDAPDDMHENQSQGPENETERDASSFDALQRLKAMLEKAVLEKESIETEYKEERQGLEREVTILREQLKHMTNEELLPGDVGDVSLHGMISECSRFVNSALEERTRSESLIKDLQKQILDLGVRDQLDRYVEGVADRMLTSLGEVVNPGELVDYSVMGKIAHVEASSMLLVEHYRWFLYEVDQLGRCLSEGGFNVGSQEDFGPGSVFAVARNELVELKRREMEMMDKVTHLQQENGKFVGQIEKEKGNVEILNAELGNLKTELEQEKNRYANTKEKLSMAVTKGKALVQQRDSLKQSLVEKTSELEKCLAELQEKYSAVEAAEQCKGELVKCEGLVGSLQETLSQRNDILESVEELFSQANVPEELQSVDIIGKLKWLLNVVASQQDMISQKNAIFDNFEDVMSQITIREEPISMDILQRLKWLVNLVASLQETLTEKNKTLETLEEIFSQVNPPAESHSMDIIESTRWLVEDRNVLKINLLEFHKLKEALSLVDIPETAPSSDLETRMVLLRESFMHAKDEINMLKDEISAIKEAAYKEIDLLSASLSAELQEKEYAMAQVDELERKYERIVEKVQQASSERDLIVKKLLEGSGIITDTEEGADQFHSDPIRVVERFFGKVKENSASIDTSLHSEVFERVQSLLYVRDQELMLCEMLLQEDMQVRSEANNLSNELKSTLLELAALKEEKDSLMKDFERSEEKSSLVREKLSIAVKKGKGLVQDREKLKILLDERNAEIEGLTCEVQELKSTVVDCRNEINQLSTDLERISLVEADLVAMTDQSAQLQQERENLTLLLDKRNSEIEKLKFEVQQQESLAVEYRHEINRLSTDLVQISKLEADLVATKDQSLELQQDREKYKLLSDEKNSEIEKLKLELQEQESLATEFRSDMERLSSDLEKMSKLEAELVAVKDQRDQLEQLLSDSKYMLQRVFKSIDHFVLPVDSVFEEPVEKLNWLARYMNDCMRELEKVKEETIALANELAEAQSTLKSRENALLAAENRISQLVEEKGEMEIARTTVEQDLQKALNEANAQSSNFSEVHAARKSLEEALSSAEDKIALLIKEREEAQLSRTAEESELDRVREEVDLHSGKLAEAYRTINSLEGALSQAETNISILTEQNNHVHIGQTNLENELNKLNDKADYQASKLLDASATIKSLEDALLKAENDLSVLKDEKKVSEEEISVLNSKLDACRNELDGSSGLFKSISLEIMQHLSGLQLLVRDERLLPMVRESFEKHYEDMKNMDAILRDIKSHIIDASHEVLQNYPDMEDDSRVTMPFSLDIGDIMMSELDDNDLNSEDADSIILYVKKAVEEVQLKNKMLANSFEGFSAFMDDFIGAFMRDLRAMKDALAVVLSQMESTKQKMKNIEMHKEEQENTIALLEKECKLLQSACTEVTRELPTDVKNNLLKLSFIPEFEKLNTSLTPHVSQLGADNVEHLQRLDDHKYNTAAENLLLASRKVQTMIKMFENTSDIAAAIIEDLQHKLTDAVAASEKAIEEKGVIQKRVFELETDVETLRNNCEELRLQTESYLSIEEKLKEKEAEISSLRCNLSVREREPEVPFLSPVQLNTLFDRISRLDIPLSAVEVEDMEPYSSVDVKKLFCIVDSVAELHHQINELSSDKDELQATLSAQTLEIKRLKEEITAHTGDEEKYEKLKAEMSDLTSGVEKIIDILGGHAITEDQKPAGVLKLLPLLEKRIAALLLEFETSKSQVQELHTELLGSHKVVGELSTKVKLLEDSLESSTSQPEIVQERSMYEAPLSAPGAEISETEDVQSIGKNKISPTPLAAHVRTMRKGSTDHLALNIDMENENLINSEETDEEKGHVFKSLNTSGLIPKQGKPLADRVDGIWVSGGRILMSRPRARLGLIAYWLVLHLWLLGTIL